MRTLINAAGLVLLVAIIVIFCVLNIERVDLNLLFVNLLEWKIEYPVWPLPLCVLVLVPLGCGLVLGALLYAVKILKLKRLVRTLSKEIEDLRSRVRSV
ncbi:MAG: LapA family protein [Deltaproteobacteria bacterium]|nr:LapA family protein [Deltaproteobacteria bacterium]